MGIANMVSLKTLERKYKITYNSREREGVFVLHTPKGKVLVKRCPRTLFPYIDLADESGEAAIALVQTVKHRYEGYTWKEVEKAIEARRLQARLGHPSEQQLKREVSHKLTPNPFV